MICPACGVVLHTIAICVHHLGAYDPEPWSASNRVVCDLVHRGIPPVRLTAMEREDPESTED